MGRQLAINPVTGKLDLVQDISETISLNDLSDVIITSATTDDFLKFNGSDWVNFALFAAFNTWTNANAFQNRVTIQSTLSRTFQVKETDIAGGLVYFEVDAGAGTVSLPQETFQGFVKNGITGILTGGNSIDISADTNLSATLPILLTGDVLSLDISPLSDIGTPVSGDLLAIEDITDGSIKKVLFSAFTGTNFLALTDTPSSYAGAGGNFVKVNSTPDALEFVASIDISDDTNLAVASPITLTGDTIGFDFSTNNTWTGTNTFREDVSLSDGTNTIFYDETAHTWTYNIKSGASVHWVMTGTESTRPSFIIHRFFPINYLQPYQ